MALCSTNSNQREVPLRVQPQYGRLLIYFTVYWGQLEHLDFLEAARMRREREAF